MTARFERKEISSQEFYDYLFQRVAGKAKNSGGTIHHIQKAQSDNDNEYIIIYSGLNYEISEALGISKSDDGTIKFCLYTNREEI
jgi:hypothetical protein